MYETLTRTHDPVAVVPGLKPISSAIERIRQVEIKKGKRRDMQISEAKRKRQEKVLEEEDKAAGVAQGDKEEEEEEATTTTTRDDDDDESEARNKKRKVDDDDNATTRRPDKEFVLKPSPYTRGHTSYLTFAVLLPVTVSNESQAVVV